MLLLQPAMEVIYVDDPNLFGVLSEVWPAVKLVQDVFHFMDRFSREIPANNTLKGK